MKVQWQVSMITDCLLLGAALYLLGDALGIQMILVRNRLITFPKMDPAGIPR